MNGSACFKAGRVLRLLNIEQAMRGRRRDRVECRQSVIDYARSAPAQPGPVLH